MRPDQQQEIPKILVTMARMAVDTIAYKEVKETIDAVAEYIAANDEFDAAFIALREAQSMILKLALSNAKNDAHTDAFHHGNVCAERVNLATSRRALAHARMKGETK